MRFSHKPCNGVHPIIWLGGTEPSCSWVQWLPDVRGFPGCAEGRAVGCHGDFLLMDLAPKRLAGLLVWVAQCCFPFVSMVVLYLWGRGCQLFIVQINSETISECRDQLLNREQWQVVVLLCSFSEFVGKCLLRASWSILIGNEVYLVARAGSFPAFCLLAFALQPSVERSCAMCWLWVLKH